MTVIADFQLPIGDWRLEPIRNEVNKMKVDNRNLATGNRQ